MEELIGNIRKWYDGYCFDMENGTNDGNVVYNSFSTLNFFHSGRFSNYWYSTGSPKFLIDLLKNNDYAVEEFENKEAELISVDNYEPGRFEYTCVIVTDWISYDKICVRYSKARLS